MLGLQRNPLGAAGIFATALMAGAGVLGLAKGNQARRKRLGLEPDFVVVPKPAPGPTPAPAPTPTPQPTPPVDDTSITYVEPTAEEMAACVTWTSDGMKVYTGGVAEAWVDENGNRFARCVAGSPNTEPAGGDATKCPAGYFYDALHKVCCPDGFYYDTKDKTCRPMAQGNPAQNP